MIRYFVSYVFGGSQGFGAGNCEVARDWPIESLSDIDEITEGLLEHGFTNVTVMSFCRFDGDD